MNAKIREIYLFLAEKLDRDDVSPYKELEIIKNRLKDWELNLLNKTEKLENVENWYGDLKVDYEKILGENSRLKVAVGDRAAVDVHQEGRIEGFIRENEILKGKLGVLEGKYSDVGELKMNYDVLVRENSDLGKEKQGLLGRLDMCESANRDLGKQVKESQSDAGKMSKMLELQIKNLTQSLRYVEEK
jgi:regulator of replication initiation timing